MPVGARLSRTTGSLEVVPVPGGTCDNNEAFATLLLTTPRAVVDSKSSVMTKMILLPLSSRGSVVDSKEFGSSKMGLCHSGFRSTARVHKTAPLLPRASKPGLTSNA